MKFSKLGLLTLLISLFIFNSCKNAENIGLDVDPNYAIEGKLVDTSTVRTVTVKEDTVSTRNLSAYPVGYINNPDIGNTEAYTAFSLTLPDDSTYTQKFSANPVLDSAVLVLKYAGTNFYGDSGTVNYTFNVQQLSQRLTGSTNYSNLVDRPANATVIGSKVVSKVHLKDSVKVTTIVRGGKDLEKNQAPQIRIPISSQFIQQNFFNAPAGTFGNNNGMNNFLKGLRVTINRNASTGKGAVFFFNMSDGGSRLELYYKNTSGTTVDTTNASFPIKQATAPVAATFKHDYTTQVITQLNNPNVSYSTTYVQGLAGLRTRVRIPYLKNLGALTVNKAELVVTVDKSTNNPFAPAPRLYLFRTDIASQRRPIPDADDSDPRSLSDANFFSYDQSAGVYRFNLTSYVQDILLGKLQQYDTFISVINPQTLRANSLLPTGDTAAEATIGGGSNPTYKMKLNIIYSKAQ